MKNSSKKVVITGLGAISGLGNSVDEIWKNCIDGKSGISNFDRIKSDHLPVKFGGEIKNFKISTSLIEEKEQKRFDLFTHYALYAANQALTDAELLSVDQQKVGHVRVHPILHHSQERIACIMGVGMGGFPSIEQNYSAYLSGGVKKIPPYFIPSVIPNMTSGLISIKYGIHGVNYSISSACASSAHALMTAANEIRLGNCDMVISGGSEAVLTDTPIIGFVNMKALSRGGGSAGEFDPRMASRPFDLNRDGFVIAEGAAVLILEEKECAIRRGAKIYAELVGGGASSDAYHITAPHPDGDGAYRCMKQALLSAGIDAQEIDYINAHGTATTLGDIAETNAIKKLLGVEQAKQIPISATKSMTGHLLGAAGALESVFCVKALESGILPPTINLQHPDPECDLFYIPNKAIKKKIKFALNNSFGFGGTNASLIFKFQDK